MNGNTAYALVQAEVKKRHPGKDYTKHDVDMMLDDIRHEIIHKKGKATWYKTGVLEKPMPIDHLSFTHITEIKISYVSYAPQLTVPGYFAIVKGNKIMYASKERDFNTYGFQLDGGGMSGGIESRPVYEYGKIIFWITTSAYTKDFIDFSGYEQFDTYEDALYEFRKHFIEE